MNFEHAYDSRGNITSEKRNGAETKYAYDALGQLVYVNDPHEGAIWYYKYDQGGNILEKRRYARGADGTQGALEGDGSVRVRGRELEGQADEVQRADDHIRRDWEPAGRRRAEVRVEHAI